MKKPIILIFLNLVFLSSSIAQNENITLSGENDSINSLQPSNKLVNSIYGTAGFGPYCCGFARGLFVSYERETRRKLFKNSIAYISVSGGVVDFGDTYGGLFLKHGSLFKLKNNETFFETNYGVILGYGEGAPLFFPAANVGYRYHSRKSGFLFRAGAGLPEIFYLSVGYKLKKKEFTVVDTDFIRKQTVRRDSLNDYIESKMKKNSIHGSLGYSLIVAGVFVSYERVVKHKLFKQSIAYINSSGGVVGSWGFGGAVIMLKHGSLFNLGNDKRFFEANYGAMYFTDSYEHYVLPAGNLGFRYHSRKSGFLFRTGAGFPETFYLSLGCRF